MHYIVLLLLSSYFYEEFYFHSNDQWQLLKLSPERTDSITIGETAYLNIKPTGTYGKQGMQGYISNIDIRSHQKPAITLV